MNLAGLPSHSSRSPMIFPGVRTAPAPKTPWLHTRAPSRTRAPKPTNAWSSRQHLISKMVQPSQVVAHAMSHPPETMGQPEQEVGHGPELGAVPARLVDAGVLRQLRILGAV